jgi:hypothetical protein
MRMTYEEIDIECDRLMAEANSLLPPECRPGVIALMQHRAGLAIRVRCVHCGGLLKATVLDLGHQGNAPLVTCPCGRSKNFLRP